MSASTLLVNGKINASYLPNGGALPADPIFQSIGIEAIPSSGGGSGDGVIALQNADGDSAYIIKGGNGSLIVLQEAESVFTVSANNLAIEIGNTTVEQLDIFSSTTLNIDCPVVSLGNSAEADPLIQVRGAGATGRVYDDHFNPVNKAPEALSSGTLSIAGGFASAVFPPPKTGLYCFTLTLGTTSASVIGTDVIAFIGRTGATGPAIPQLSTYIPPDTILYTSGAPSPNYYTYNFFGYLTENDDIYFTITPIGSAWAGISYVLNAIQMC